MSVHFKPKTPVTPSTYKRPTLVARDLLSTEHPLHATLVAWLKGKALTKAQAAKFLAAHPYYRVAQQG